MTRRVPARGKGPTRLQKPPQKIPRWEGKSVGEIDRKEREKEIGTWGLTWKSAAALDVRADFELLP